MYEINYKHKYNFIMFLFCDIPTNYNFWFGSSIMAFDYNFLRVFILWTL